MERRVVRQKDEREVIHEIRVRYTGTRSWGVRQRCLVWPWFQVLKTTFPDFIIWFGRGECQGLAQKPLALAGLQRRFTIPCAQLGLTLDCPVRLQVERSQTFDFKENEVGVEA